jgi:hypothetical protein
VNDNEEISTYSSMLESTPLYLIQICYQSYYTASVCACCLFLWCVCVCFCGACVNLHLSLCMCVCGVSVVCLRHVYALRICESASLSSNVRTHPHDHTLVHATAP